VDQRLPFDTTSTSFRSDDGRPFGVTVTQRQGKIHAAWREDSLCSDRFSVERVVLDSRTVWQHAVSNYSPEEAAFKYSNEVEKAVQAGRYRAKSVVTDFFATSSSCNDTFGVVVDDIHDLWDELAAEYVVGQQVVYCIVASNPAIEACKLCCVCGWFKDCLCH
jgi:hypothetical protein